MEIIGLCREIRKGQTGWPCVLHTLTTYGDLLHSRDCSEDLGVLFGPHVSPVRCESLLSFDEGASEPSLAM
jgi:hypothetical protein